MNLWFVLVWFAYGLGLAVFQLMAMAFVRFVRGALVRKREG